MRQQFQNNSGPKGRAKVNFNKASIRIYTAEGENLEIARESVGENCFVPAKTQVDNAFYQLSPSADELQSLRPYSGSFLAKFNYFASKKGELPTPKFNPGGNEITLDDGRKFTTKPKHTFTPMLQIVGGGDWENCIVPYTLDYLFQPDKDGNTSIVGTPKPMEKVVNFLGACGFNVQHDNIKWSENILPLLEETLQEFEGTFIIKIEKGYVKTVEEIPVGMPGAKVKKTSASEEDAPKRRGRPAKVA